MACFTVGLQCVYIAVLSIQLGVIKDAYNEKWLRVRLDICINLTLEALKYFRLNHGDQRVF